MKRFLHSLLFAISACAGLGAVDPDRLLIKAVDGAPPGIVRQVLSQHDLALAGSIDELGITIARAKPGKGQGVMNALGKNPWILAEVDGELQAVPIPAEDASAQAVEWFQAITRTDVAHAAGYKGANISVTVLDSGADLKHPFIAPRVGDTANFVTTTDTSFKPDAQDTDGHGTACFTLVAQEAPEARIHVGRVMYRNSALWSAVARGILWGKDRSQIISISIGGSSNSFSLTDAIAKANASGCVVIVAAGNYANSTPQYPAQTAGSIAVSATDQGDAKAGFSSYGNGTTSVIDISAPGVSLRAGTIGGGWSYFSGTSGSTPITAGITALVQGRFGGSGLEAFVRVQAGAKKLNYPLYFGAGRVDVAGALGLAPVDSVPAPSKMSAPVITATTSTSATFTWTAVAGAPGYNLMQGLGGYQFETLSGGTTQYTWRNLKASTEYRVAVRVLGMPETLSDFTIFRTTAADVPPPIEETWTEKSAESIVRTNYAPATVEQSRTVTTTTRTWEESNLGNKRNEQTAVSTATETRTVPVPVN